MEQSKIEMKLEMELEPIKEMCKPLEEAVKHELSRGIENVDTKELGEVVDMIKDLYEAKEKIVKTCYYKSVIEAMEEYDFEDEEDIMDEGRRGYRGQPRSKTSGRYMSRGDGRRSNRGRRGYDEPMGDYEMTPEMYRMYSPEYYRDIDKENLGRMFYSGGSSGGGSRGYSQNESGNQQTSRSENARRGYVEAKEMHKGNSAEDKEVKKKELDKWMTEFSNDVKQMVSEMTPEEKTVLKTKLQNLHSSI